MAGRTFSLWGSSLWVRVFGLALTVFLAYPLFGLADKNHLYYTAIIAFAAGYIWVIWRSTSDLHGNQASLAIIATLACGAALLPVLQVKWLSGLSVYASVMLLCDCPLHRWRMIVAALVGVSTVLAVVLHAEAEAILFLVLLILIASGAQIAIYKQLETSLHLQNARVELARLAVAEERLRIARDLHDILGQKLSAIALRAELAACIIEHEPERAAHEIADVAVIARDTLAEVKAAVSGYRQVSLAAEAQAATALLTTSGLNVTVEGAVEGFQQPPVDECAAWVIREAVTNVIRHAQARNCQIVVSRTDDTVLVEVRDDGIGAKLSGSPISGTGLRGLRERVKMVDGEFSAEPRDGWFVVRAILPLNLVTAEAE